MNIVIDGIPIPPSKLSPNARTHFAVKAKLTQLQREAAKLSAMHAVANLEDWQSFAFPWSEVVVETVWYRQTKRQMDRDNALACLKSTFDGFVDAGVLDDDRELIPLPVRFELDRENPRLVITLRRRESGK